MDKLKELQNELVALRDKANAIEETAEKEERKLTADEWKEISGLLDQIDELESIIKTAERKQKNFAELEEATESMVELEKVILGQVEELVHAAGGARATVIVVSNEVGQGVVPSFKAGRVFRDLAGLANQSIAREADEVYMMWAGIPQKIKGEDVAENKR